MPVWGTTGTATGPSSAWLAKQLISTSNTSSSHGQTSMQIAKLVDYYSGVRPYRGAASSPVVVLQGNTARPEHVDMQGFLTAVLQTHARKHGVAVDSLVFRSKITNYMLPAEVPAPPKVRSAKADGTVCEAVQEHKLAPNLSTAKPHVTPHMPPGADFNCANVLLSPSWLMCFLLSLKAPHSSCLESS